MNHLDGEQALIHARNRSIGNSDYRRTERQQEVLMAAFAKIKDLGVFDIAGLVKDVLPMVTTDLSLWDITGYAMDVMNIGTVITAATGLTNSIKQMTFIYYRMI